MHQFISDHVIELSTDIPQSQRLPTILEETESFKRSTDVSIADRSLMSNYISGALGSETFIEYYDVLVPVETNEWLNSSSGLGIAGSIDEGDKVQLVPDAEMSDTSDDCSYVL